MLGLGEWRSCSESKVQSQLVLHTNAAHNGGGRIGVADRVSIASGRVEQVRCWLDYGVGCYNGQG
jgi:hypothetical protein